MVLRWLFLHPKRWTNDRKILTPAAIFVYAVDHFVPGWWGRLFGSLGEGLGNIAKSGSPRGRRS